MNGVGKLDRRGFIKAAAVTPVIGAMCVGASSDGASGVPTWCATEASSLP